MAPDPEAIVLPFEVFDKAESSGPTVRSYSGPGAAFAGIWRLWWGECKGETGEHRLFAFLTTVSNDVVRPIHAKAMPVILTNPAEFDVWLDGTVNDAITLQRPLPNELLQIVAMGEKSDSARIDV
jgi:putative SOS response-associated peptidase YedK